MKRLSRISLVAALSSVLMAAGPFAPDVRAAAARQMESLGRGVVAVRASSADVLVTWRLPGLDRDGIGFHVYRSTAGGPGRHPAYPYAMTLKGYVQSHHVDYFPDARTTRPNTTYAAR